VVPNIVWELIFRN